MPVSEYAPTGGAAISPIAVAEEEAIIAYDSRTGTERFIRKATFDTRDRDFGFLVPTPSVPTLSASSDALFARLQGLIQTPVIEKRMRFIWGQPVPTKSLSATSAAAPGGGSRYFPEVDVQEIKRVGDYEAAVLKATDTGALLGWLKKYGYASSPELEEWVAPYVRQGYAITAFRIAADVRGNHALGAPVRLSPVCLTFQTPAPFYPYREGKNAAARNGRLLRVYYFGDKRVTGRLGDSLADASEEWGAQDTQSRAITPTEKTDLGSGNLGLQPNQIGDRLTVFEDRTSLRARKDLFFTAAPDQAMQVPTRVVYNDVDVSAVVLPMAGSMLLGTGLAWWVRRRSSRR
jgi:hypothetical protein